MKKKLLFLVIPLVILCFVILFSMASEKTRKRNAEIAQIHHSAKVAIGDYLKGETVKMVSFNICRFTMEQIVVLSGAGFYRWMNMEQNT